MPLVGQLLGLRGRGLTLPCRAVGRVLVMRTVVDLPDWRLRGRVDEGHECDLADFDLFFGPDDESEDQRRYRERAAARVCGQCPVAAECLELALRNGEVYGVWGGLGEKELRREVRARRRAVRRGETAA